jgi:hypothetical protein
MIVRLAAAALLLVAGAGDQVLAQAKPIRVPYSADTLANGLVLVVHQDHSVPIVSVSTRHVMAISSGAVQRVARKYLAPEQTSIVVVGDLKKIRPGIAALGLGPLQKRGAWGQPKSVP